MKKINYLAVLFAGLAAVACNNATPATTEETQEDAVEQQKVLTAKDYVPSKAEVDSVSYLVGVNFGSFIKGYNFGDKLNYGEILKGMKDFVAAKGDYRADDFGKQFKHDPNGINKAFNAFLEKRQHYTSLTNKEVGEKFLASNAKKAGVAQTESGLQYEIIEKGNDVVPGAKDTVWVHYKGTLLDGTVFDETAEGADPIHFTLNSVIKGWQEGLQLIGEGGKIKLYVPSSLGYGESGTQAIGPNSTLIFDVELNKVGKVPVEPTTEAETK